MSLVCRNDIPLVLATHLHSKLHHELRVKTADGCIAYPHALQHLLHESELELVLSAVQFPRTPKLHNKFVTLHTSLSMPHSGGWRVPPTTWWSCPRKPVGIVSRSLPSGRALCDVHSNPLRRCPDVLQANQKAALISRTSASCPVNTLLAPPINVPFPLLPLCRASADSVCSDDRSSHIANVQVFCPCSTRLLASAFPSRLGSLSAPLLVVRLLISTSSNSETVWGRY